jgi:hypothetical protein
MRKTIIPLAACLALMASPAGAQPVPAQKADKIDPALFDALLATARTYAADRSLIFYCLRKDDEIAPFLYAGVHLDIAYALQLLRAYGADERQRARLVEAVLRNVQSAKREDNDPARDRICTDGEVEKNVMVLKGAGTPLFMRAPFEKLKP